MSAEPVCPECKAGKHLNCTEESWDHEADGLVACRCRCQVKTGVVT